MTDNNSENIDEEEQIEEIHNEMDEILRENDIEFSEVGPSEIVEPVHSKEE